MYRKYIKRILDFTLSLIALIVLSPVLLIVAILVRIKLGSPVIFKQERPGLDEKDEQGNLLPDSQRLTKFGKMLRSTSLDELPELINILKGDMAIVGPRPLRVRYLPFYTEEESHRHDVRPGLTGLAQINGRNSISWDEKFKYDIEYVHNINFKNDTLIILKTVKKVFEKENIELNGTKEMLDFDKYRSAIKK